MQLETTTNYIDDNKFSRTKMEFFIHDIDEIFEELNEIPEEEINQLMH